MEMEESKKTTHELDVRTLSKVAMVVVMGLPGSGKTSLCKVLPHILGCEYHVVHVCYDELVPFSENWAEEDSHGAWKKERAKVLCDVELFLCRVIKSHGLKNTEHYQTSSEQNKDINLVVDQSQYTEKSQCIKSEESFLFKCESIQKQDLCESLSGEPEFSAGTVKHLNSFTSEDSNLLESNNFKWHNYISYSILNDTRRDVASLDRLITDLHHIETNKVILVCIDDNLYYHSMRKEWWNLAAKYKMPFCTLVLQCDVETCIERVKERERNGVETINVPVDTIVRMAKRLEFPDEKIYSWEKYYYIIDSNVIDLKFKEIDGLRYNSLLKTTIHESSLKEFLEIKATLFRSLQDPAKPLDEVIISEHVITTPSVIHVVDLVLRQIVAKSDISAKAANNRKRKVVLDGLRNGKLNIPASVLDEGECRRDELEIYLITLIDSI